MTKPTFLVAGAGRSGTTGLVEGLRAHRRVFVTYPKEPHYFALHGESARFAGPGDGATINAVAVTKRQDYLNLYPREGEHSYLALGDGSVTTMFSYERAIPEILRMNPEMKVIVLLREPTARAYSAYLYMRARGLEPCADFMRAIDDEPRRRQEGWQPIWLYTQMSRYAAAVAAFQQALAPEHLGIWFYEDMVADYQALRRQVFEFLRVPLDEEPLPEVPYVNISGAPRNRTLQRGIWWATRHEPIRRAAKRMTSFHLRERARRNLLRAEPLSSESKTALRDVFADDIRELSQRIPRHRQPAWLSCDQSVDG